MKNDKNTNRFYMTTAERDQVARNMRQIEKDKEFYDTLFDNSSAAPQKRINEPFSVGLLKIIVYIAYRIWIIIAFLLVCFVLSKIAKSGIEDFFSDMIDKFFKFLWYGFK